MTARKYKNMNFAFDHVFGETTDNETIYQDIMHPLLDTLLGGFNCSGKKSKRQNEGLIGYLRRKNKNACSNSLFLFYSFRLRGNR